MDAVPETLTLTLLEMQAYKIPSHALTLQEIQAYKMRADKLEQKGPDWKVVDPRSCPCCALCSHSYPHSYHLAAVSATVSLMKKSHHHLCSPSEMN